MASKPGTNTVGFGVGFFNWSVCNTLPLTRLKLVPYSHFLISASLLLIPGSFFKANLYTIKGCKNKFHWLKSLNFNQKCLITNQNVK